MKIGIAGYGFVGKAHELILEEYHDIIVSDPAQGQYGDLRHADAIIVCVSTPQGSSGGCHMDNVYEVIEDAPNVPILIKSTISIEGWDMLKHVFPNSKLTFSPEFLRAVHWKTDIRLQDHMYVGGSDTGFWAELFISVLGPISVSTAEPKELIAAKQLRNSFLALKVTYFNQVKDFCEAQGIDFESVRKVITDDKRINASHSQVARNARGYGGHCFPKDVLATITSAVGAGGSISILEEAHNYNHQFRKDQT